MATIISQAVFSVVWTTSYPSLLADGTGRLTTRGRYAAVFDAPGANLGLPWTSITDPPSWNRFWSSYLRTPKAMRQPNADTAWEHVIPFQVWHQPDLSGPPGSTARARVLLHPCSVSVIITVRADGIWPVNQLAAALADLSAANHWGTANPVTTSRTLHGIATDLRDRAAALLVPGGEPVPEPDHDIQHTVAAPVLGEGNKDDLALTDATVRSCVAGLAVLGPPGELDEARLLAANSNARRAGRLYVVTDGHAIWHPAAVLDCPPVKDPLGCLVRNHSDLVAHVEALGGIVEWAAEQVAAGVQIPVEVQSLIRTAAGRLRILHGGKAKNTYRSGLAMIRAQPMITSVEAVLGAL